MGRVSCSVKGVCLVFRYGLALWVRALLTAGLRARFKAGILMLGVWARD